jgi:hypothetical protein
MHPSVVTSLLRLAAATAAGRTVRRAAAAAALRVALALGAALSGAVGVFCFSVAALTLLERQMDPAEAWAMVGSFYGVMGGFLYFASTSRRPP